ncbi:MAG: lipocalin-like domain-containing protein [Desulfococcaceae bacterium]
MNRTGWILLGLAALAVGIVWFQRGPERLGSVESAGDYRVVDGPCGLEFPRDHGPHPDHKTEWWYYTGNLTGSEGDRYGFQLTFFRHRIVPPAAEADWPEPRSPWRTAQIYLAHAAVSDIDGGRFFQADRVARGARGISGAGRDDAAIRVHLRNWSLNIRGEEHQLRADAPELGLNLTLRAQKPPVPHGEDGYSRKGEKRESASCYYSLTRMAVSGELTPGPDAESVSVSGHAWMDHEFSSAPLEENLEGWDWFSLQLDDETELMVYLLRRKDGGLSAASSATVVAADGTARHVENDGISLEVTDTWESPHTNAVYPAGWRMTVSPAELELRISSLLPDQEMRTDESTGVSYWEGAVSVEGTRSGGEPVSGIGYVELTGYAREFDAPM